tara:strand:- start:9026 stop:9781 length:756 start_codon:yes stop_codon:yes gene_type:complete
MNNINNNKPIVFLTTPTSATASMWRIISLINRNLYKMVRYTDEFYHNGELEKIKTSLLPSECGNIILFNTPMFFNFEQDLTSFRYMVNVRDPRDLLCNMYHWALVHPDPSENDKSFRERIDLVRKTGIDQFVMDKDIKVFYSNIIKLWEMKKVVGFNGTSITYSKLCTDFDSFIDRISNFINSPITSKELKKLETERIEKLSTNKDWIGNHWNGSDVLPGRYKNELQSSTITWLNNKYRNEIDFCNMLDKE